MSVIESSTAPRGARIRRTRSKAKASQVLFAFTAASAFVLVTIVDPYSGATASPYFQIAPTVVDRFDGQNTQTLAIAGGFTNTVTRDGFAVTEIVPEPEPVVVASVPEQSDDSEADAAEPKVYTAPPAAVPDPGSAKAYAYTAIASRGWGEEQYNCLVSLWQKESGWNVAAMNSSSGAYGIPQSLPGSKMSSAGSDWETNAGTQIEWGLGYITDRYGSPCGAWAKSQNSGWY
ncbi:lytic transglycosylase domain-containing protein [Cryobacterium frigoriphilum]|uniref:aggregation-promoting factor C-terminal-like domain-containing protein n=1 Tax=Cryobacterium frigoriphilum TaxID=1259150 RepID=UPI001F5458D7|nr:lytic transglycosylase domain-containing protein [Cryobacterium frigoriphilum]